jgi:hypothetical protein
MVVHLEELYEAWELEHLRHNHLVVAPHDYPLNVPHTFGCPSLLKMRYRVPKLLSFEVFVL